MSRGDIIFDLDGTLIETQALYVRAKEEFHTLMTSTIPGVTRDQSEEVMNEIDIGNTKFGWIRDRFPGSMIETYLALCALYDVEFQAPVLGRCAKIGYQVFQWRAEEKPEVRPVLLKLAKDYNLHLYTMGDPEVQHYRIDNFPAAQLFASITIPPHKDTETLTAYLRANNLNSLTTWYVGDSLKSDILPAVENGLKAIHLKNADEWDYNQADIPGGYLVAENLTDIVDLITIDQSDKVAV